MISHPPFPKTPAGAGASGVGRSRGQWVLSGCPWGALLGCPQLPAVPPASSGAARRQIPPLQRSDPGHGRFSPAPRGTATHPALPHVRAPLGDAASHPHPGELLQLPPNSQKLRLCLRSATPGLSRVRCVLWLLTADYVFKSALVEQQAAAGRRGAGTRAAVAAVWVPGGVGWVGEVLTRPGTR